MSYCHCCLCGREINDLVETRFVIRFDVSEAENKLKPVLPDKDTDPLEMMTKLIMSCEGEDTCSNESSSQYNLCGDCHSSFLKDPFGLKNSRKIRFSLN
jgi:hypothetical protein